MLDWAVAEILSRGAKTPLCGFYVAAGASCLLATNSESILEAAGQAFLEVSKPPASVDVHLRLWVDPGSSAEPPWPKPYCRGLDDVVFMGLDGQNSLLVDRRTRRALGRFSPAMGDDQAYWKAVIFPNLLTFLGPAIGVTGLHCACVVRGGFGVLLSGPASSGKSTLTLALVRRGFSFLSDDWTYFSQLEDRLCAWGPITKLKLLPDAAAFFPELGGFEAGVSVNGERAYEIEPDLQLGVSRSRYCEPRRLIFLERSPSPEFSLIRMPAAEAAAHLEQYLLAETAERISPQLAIIRRLADQDCWRLRYGGAPDDVAQKLAAFCGVAAYPMPESSRRKRLV